MNKQWSNWSPVSSQKIFDSAGFPDDVFQGKLLSLLSPADKLGVQNF